MAASSKASLGIYAQPFVTGREEDRAACASGSSPASRRPWTRLDGTSPGWRRRSPPWRKQKNCRIGSAMRSVRRIEHRPGHSHQRSVPNYSWPSPSAAFTWVSGGLDTRARLKHEFTATPSDFTPRAAYGSPATHRAVFRRSLGRPFSVPRACPGRSEIRSAARSPCRRRERHTMASPWRWRR